MTRRAQIYLLGGLLAVLALVVYGTFWGGSGAITVFTAEVKFEPLSVENPSLRLDLLESIHKQKYNGSQRNIFSASLPPPPTPVVARKEALVEQPPPPPPLEVPVKFFGYAADPATGKKRAFFTNGEDVFILGEGEVLQNRFRLLRIGNNTAEMEEVQTGRRASLPLEQPPAGGL